MRFSRKTIGQMLNEISQEHPERDALIHPERSVRYNYAILSWELDRISRGLIGVGIDAGKRVAIWAPNIPEWLISMLALARIGAVTVPIDPGAKMEDLQFILEQSGCEAIIINGDLEDEQDGRVKTAIKMKEIIPAIRSVLVVARRPIPETVAWAELALAGEDVTPAELQRVQDGVRPDDPVAIMYTSGTTGSPKGVVLDHLGLINKSISSTERQGITHEDRLCLFFPLFHMFGNTCIALAGLVRGAALIMPCQGFDLPKILKAIYEEACTAIYASPSMLISLLDHPEFDEKRWSGLRRGIIGGSPCPMELMRRVVEEIGISEITVGYGITETSSWVTMTRPDDPIGLRVSTIGTPLDCNQVKIVDPRTGEDLPPNRQGELCTKGFLMKGYYKMPGATAAAIDPAGWFHTGDLGEMDGRGYVKITGRLKDVIVRDGIEIYPVEVEEVIYGLSEVSEAQVFGFPHPEKGQEVAAWVKVKEGPRLSPEDVAAHVNMHLQDEKRPHYFKIVRDFPMTRSGKVQKFRLAEMARNEYSEIYSALSS
jgi:fatty-acyl-CoA synthase